MSRGVEYRQQVLALLRGYRSAQVLISCSELGVFETIRDGAVTPEALAERLGAHPTTLSRLLGAAIALGLLQKDGAGYANSPLAATCLAQDGPFYLGNLVRREGAFYRRWSWLTEAVRTGKRPAENVRDEQEGNWVHDFELALYDIARTAAPAIAEAIEPLLPQRAGLPIRVIDIGGGHGAYAVALARRNPTFEAVVFDLPPVIEVAPAIIPLDDLAGRVLFRAGDFKIDDLGGGLTLPCSSASWSVKHRRMRWPCCARSTRRWFPAGWSRFAVSTSTLIAAARLRQRWVTSICCSRRMPGPRILRTMSPPGLALLTLGYPRF